MKLSMKQWLMIGIGAVVLYLVYKKMNETKETVDVDPTIVPEKDYTQGDLYNEKFSARGGYPYV